MYLVKWCGLEYSESTWEDEEEICRDGAGQVGSTHNHLVHQQQLLHISTSAAVTNLGRQLCYARDLPDVPVGLQLWL